MTNKAPMSRAILETFDAIEAVSGRTEKLNLLRGLLPEQDARLRELFDSVHNPFRNFWVSAPSLDEFNGTVAGGDEAFDEFFQILKTLSNREATGSTAKELVREFFGRCDELERKWFWRILGRDLGMGLALGSVNAIFPGLIPSFDVMLCATLEPAELEAKLGREVCVIEPKIDGVRCLMFKRAGSDSWDVMSRNGKPFWNWEHIVAELNEVFSTEDGVVLDGELFYQSLRKTLSIAKTQGVHPDAPHMKFIAWDLVAYDEWVAGNVGTTILSDRRLELEARCGAMTTVDVVIQKAVQTVAELTTFFRSCLDVGFEGAVLKDAASFYKKGNRAHWVKVKPTYTDEFEVTATEEGRGKNVGSLGAFVVRNTKTMKQKNPHVVEAAPGKLIANVGGGLTDKDRDAFWAKRDEMIGKMITVEYKMITAADEAGNFSLREPIFVAVRDYE